jgi:hypothetical protein
MDIPRKSTTGARPRFPGRSSSQTSNDCLRPQAIGIPGIQSTNDVPPPLPPPRYNDDLAHGDDLAWRWANKDPFESQRQLAPIKPGSSLFGSYLAKRCTSDMDLDDDDFARRNSSASTVRSPSHSSSYHGASVPTLARKPPSPTASNQRLVYLAFTPFRARTVSGGRPTTQIAGYSALAPGLEPHLCEFPALRMQTGGGLAAREPIARIGKVGVSTTMLTKIRLHGEMPLAQRDFDRSSQAYDQRLLSKIGKPNSPPRHQHSGSGDSISSGTKLSLQTKNSQLLSANDTPSSTFDPVSRWITSPASASTGVSPGFRSGWRDYMGPRSPSVESASTPLVLDPELFVQVRGNGAEGALGNEDLTSNSSRSHRGSYDHGVLAEESEMSHDTSGLRDLNLGGNSRSYFAGNNRHLKRRAGSPISSDMARDDKSPSRDSIPDLAHPRGAHTTTLRTPGAGARHYQTKYGSVSSTASSVSARHNSYASSIALSVAASSMTSASSSSPLDPSPHTAYITSAPTSATTLPTSILPTRSIDTNVQPSIRKILATHASMNEPRVPTRVGNHFICDCCPKKPKKFESEEQLRAHQMEKQFTCQYCNNRFKNKNEAERHQNSLHLRRHSWSCAAITNVQAAFHPTSSPPTAQAQSDTCGYCGEEFPNQPRPDWDSRIEHLTNVHKFGECNQAKKFYRADHFRQHLKHSHAGQSGKWTNILENVCLREEMPLNAAGGHSPTETDPRLPRDVGIDGVTIDEDQEET